jgi:hypothetical protein
MAHDLGLAAWFGGSLMGAVGLNGAAQEVKDSAERPRVASAGWARWAPVNAAAVGVHLVGGALIVKANKGRVVGQTGVVQWTAAKTALTGAALAATAYAGALGRTVQVAGSVPADSGTEPSQATPAEAAAAMKRLQLLQWAIPVLTGGIVVASAVMGEQQRPSEVVKGAAVRAAKATQHLATHPAQATQLAGAVASRYSPR